ncbi:MAG: MBL fold metallo-hydrolase [Acidobacteriota bacterium]
MSVQENIVTEIAPGIFRIPMRLPIPEVGSMNSYVLVDAGRHLIVDPGMAHPECCGIMEKAIEDLGLDPACIDFFITHHHLDHFSSVSRFLSETSRIYISRSEADHIERIASGEAEKETAALLEGMGFPEKKPMNAVPQFFSDAYSRKRSWPFHYVADGDILERGGRCFTCLVSPGHSNAHSCLFESTLALLISGDEITAGVQFLLDRADPLADHYESLAQLRKLDVRLALPGHGDPFEDHRGRIDRLMAHHRGRAEAVYGALQEYGKDAYEVTLSLDGLLPGRDRLDAEPLVRKFIHTRHTFAYLLNLAAQGRARKEVRQGRFVFFR